MRVDSDIVPTSGTFQVLADFEPAGDQPTAIADLERRLRAGEKDVVLLGATGTGKSATAAWLIEKLQRPTLIMAPNKTLAAQLANELREMLPNNAVEYFVSYYDYYQPEAYVPQTDTYIEKDSSVNSEVERLRHSATMSLLTRRDVVVVATVSCIYGLGTPQEYVDRSVRLRVGQDIPRDKILRGLVDVQYSRNDLSFTRGTFRVRGDTVEIFPAYEELAIRVEMFGDEIERLYYLHPLTGEVVREVDEVFVFPATHYAAGPERMERAIRTIEAELAERLAVLERELAELDERATAMTTAWRAEKDRLADTQKLKEQLDQARSDVESAQRRGELGRASELLYGVIPDLEKRIASGQDGGKLVNEAVDEQQIAGVVSRWTGVPVDRMLEGERAKLLRMEDELRRRVVGQEEALRAVANAVRRARAGLQDPARPIGSFLFLGPTGVGKTELAKALAGFLFDDDRAMVRIDMSEFMEKHA
ncbi:MAG: AAA family ATPase, partial [Actinomycetota bacterium]|nr:AAA family ATPase [Actinomycetota bacterium]